MNPIVSVSCLVFNQRDYLRQCLDSIVEQKTSFFFEILIHDDASTDGSKEIIEEYAAKYPNLVKPYYQEHNQYSIGKGFVGFSINLKRAKGKFIAFCEGDDYWTDCNKLQKQVDYLDSHNEMSICFHDVKIFDARYGAIVDDFITQNVKEDTSIRDLIESNYIQTVSVMIRKNDKINDDFDKLGVLPACDYPFWLLMSTTGGIHKIHDSMAVYRYGSGVWSSYDGEDITKDQYKRVEIILFALLKYFKNDEILRDKIVAQLQDAFEKREKNIDRFYMHYCKHIEYVNKSLSSMKASKAYRFGKILLLPFSCFQNKK